ncbi:NAD(P)-binding domain [Phytophthora cactorum]|nr:NAD(P)-binding domain [Phytophthora cactorum]
MEHQPLRRQPDTSRYGSVPEVAIFIAPASSRTFIDSLCTFFRSSPPLSAPKPPSNSTSSPMPAISSASLVLTLDLVESSHLDNGNLGAAIDSFMALVSVVFAGMYIANTYIPFNSASILPLTDVGLSAVADDARLPRQHSACLPASFFIRYHTFWYGESWWRFVYPARFAMCYMTGSAVLSRCHAYLNPVRQFAFLCYLQITCILLGAAGIIQIAETMDGTLSVKNLGEWTFFNSFFNSVMTFVTIDKPPSENALSKVFVGVLVCIFILVIPYQISNVMDLSNSVSPYEEASYKPSSNSRHVVLCGDLTASRIRHFFHEIFHNDHDFVGVHVVVLSEEPPATSLKALLLDPFFAKRVRVGDEEFSVSDHRTLMRVLAARRQAPKAHVFAQLHRSVHCQLVRDMGVQNVLCLSEVTLSLLGQNCICPGFSTFMYSLTSTSSFDDDNDEGLGSDAKRTNRSTAVDKGEGSWVDRYLLGASHEVYVVELPPASVVAGKTFSELASLAYSHCNGIIVFAVADGPRGKVVLNPGDSYSCVGGETAYVIAQTQADASALTEMSPNASMPLAWREMQVSSPSSLVRSETVQVTSLRQELLSSDTKHALYAGNLETMKPQSLRRRRKGKNLSITRSLRNPPSPLKTLLSTMWKNFGFGVAPIVICVTADAAFATDLEHLIGPLRARSLKQYHPVVILSAKLPDDDIYDGFSHFPDVHFVIGDPYRHKTLNRAGVSEAYRVLILGTSNSASEGNAELLQDAESIALHRFITSYIGVNKARELSLSVHFVAQNLLANGWFPGSDGEDGLTMFSSTETFSRNFFLSPAFTSGLTYSTSLCDSLLINQFFNGRIKKILGEFMFTSRASEAWAALRGDKSKPDLQRSSLFAVEVPLDFVGRSFEYVFHYLLSSDDILVIGLYRCHPYMNAANETESKARIEVPEKDRSVPFGYVYVNPQPFEVITGDDLLYVLSDKQPCWAETQNA